MTANLKHAWLSNIYKIMTLYSDKIFVDESFIELVPDSNESIIKYVKKFPMTSHIILKTTHLIVKAIHV